MTLQPPQPSRYSPTDSKERNYQQIRVRQDTNENWLKSDPKPASGEWCYSIGWANDPTPRDPANNNPPASKEWYGKFCVDANRDIWECTATSDSQSPPNLVYNWVPVLEDGENVKYKPPVASQCVKIGDSTTPWSQLPWLGGRGIPGPQGDTGDGVRVIGVLGECDAPTAEQAPNPEIGDMWIVSCDDRSPTASACMLGGCDGTAWVWSGTEWQFIGKLQGPAGNNVEYYYQEFAANAGGTKFQLDSTVQVQATFVTINGVILLPNDYTFTDNTYEKDGVLLEGCELEFLNDIPLKDDDIIMVFSFKGAIDAAVRSLTTADIATLGVRPVEALPVPRGEIKNQQEVNWYLMDAVDSLEDTVGGTLEDYATQEWVIDKSYITEQVVTDAVQFAADDQKDVDDAQDREIEQIESRVSQIESVSLDAKYLYEGDSAIPRTGQFACLKTNGTELAHQWADTQMLVFDEKALEGVPDWDHVTAGDVLRIGGSSSGIVVPVDVAPAEIEHREADTFAEFKVRSVPDTRLFEVELIRGDGQPMPGVEYGILLLSSFDPSGLATTDFVVSELAKKASLDANNKLTGKNTFEGLTYFESAIISKSKTVLELKGDSESVQERYLKVRGNAQFSVYAYPGENNDKAKNAFSILMKPGDTYPVTSLNYLSDPVSSGHAVCLRYANANYVRKDEDRTLTPIVFKSAQGCKPTDLTSPTSGKAAFMNAPELGGQKNSNKYFGNCNNGIRIHKDSMKNAAGEIFASSESYDVSGFVSVYGKENQKLYLKAPVVKVSRLNDFVDISFTHSGWAPAINYGRGDTTEQSEFIIIVEALGVDESGGQRAALERLKK